MGSELLMQARQKKGTHGGATRQEFEEAYAGCSHLGTRISICLPHNPTN